MVRPSGADVTIGAKPNSLPTFFGLVFALSIPFWLIGAATEKELLPRLPVSALMAVLPAAVALLLVHRKGGSSAMAALLMRSFDFSRIPSKFWYLPIVFLAPGVAVLSYATLRLLGVAIPPPTIPGARALILFGVFFVGALGEELGWSGFAIDPMQTRWSALQAGVVLGLAWAVWHYVPLMEAHRPAAWIAWWSIGTVSMRVVMVWLFNNTGKSVFAVALLHAMSDLCWQLFPVYGSYFDPRSNALILAFLAAIVTIIWGYQTLTRTGRPTD